MENGFCNDIKNIIEKLIHQYRLNRLQDEYRAIFWFFDAVYDYRCPNPQGRCVGRWQNVKIHFLDGRLHRKDGPAEEFVNGDKFWYYEGRLHREYGPACERLNRDKWWFFKGQLHRNSNEGPAVECANGNKFWYYKNQLHRDPKKGPAVKYADGRPNEYWEFGNMIIK